MPGNVFRPTNSGTISGDQRIVLAGSDGTGTIGRNVFFTHGMNNFDVAFSKAVAIKEGINLNLRMEFYNLFNRVMFDTPALTIFSSTPLGRISGQRNPANYVNSARIYGSRMGQFSLRLTF